MSARDLTAGSAADYVLPPTCGTAGQVLAAPSVLTSGRKQLVWAGNPTPGTPGVTLVGAVTLTFTEQGGDASTCTLTGNLYNSGSVMFLELTGPAGGGITIASTGLLQASTPALITASPPSGITWFSVIAWDQTANSAEGAACNINPGTGQINVYSSAPASALVNQFKVGDVYTVASLHLSWQTSSPPVEADPVDDLLRDFSPPTPVPPKEIGESREDSPLSFADALLDE